jgi:hypothetical protein
MYLAADYPFLDVLWTMLVFFAWVIWFWLLITVFSDLFRRHDVSGWGKAGWTILIIFLPLLGVCIYLLSQGKGLAEREMAKAQKSQGEFDNYVKTVAGSNPAEEIAKAKALLDSGAIDAEEFNSLKAKALA